MVLGLIIAYSHYLSPGLSLIASLIQLIKPIFCLFVATFWPKHPSFSALIFFKHFDRILVEKNATIKWHLID